MSKIFFTGFLFFLFLLFSFVFVQQAYADDPRISVTHSPKPVKVDSGNITFTITNTEGLFDTNHQYHYAIFYPDRMQFCNIGDQTTPVDANKIEAKIPLIGCKIEQPGERIFQLWYSGGTDNKSGLIVSNYRFVIEQVGGGLPSIEPFRNPPIYGLSETPQVILINARAGNKYELWWDGSKTEWADKYTAPNDGNFTRNLAKNGVDFNKDGNKKLCMWVGDNRFPAEVKCSFATDFVFTSISPPPVTGNPSCSILPANPAEDDSVSIKAVNLPNNQEFWAKLISSIGTTTNIPQIENSGSSSTVIIQLESHSRIGSYTGIVLFNNSNQELCKKEFTVGPKKTVGGITPVDLCKTNPDLCATAKGIPCGNDVKDPGIATAIGCIHTNPLSFIKDFLKFIIGISGGLAFLLMLLGAFQMITSAGNPETLQAGRDRFQSAIIGLLFVIFAVLLLQIIGVDILGLGEQFGGP